MDSEIVFTEKACSRCDRLNWDSTTGDYNEDCTAEGFKGQKCDTDGQVFNFDKDNNLIK
jgi:hypothetical protein